MLFEGLVGVMALIAASALHPGDYFAINTTPAVFATLGHADRSTCRICSRRSARTSSAAPAARCRWRVGMAQIFCELPGMRGLMAYWYHFAIMFEALFILTTIDSGTRVGRFLLQEFDRPRLAEVRATPNWLPGALVSTGVMVLLWGYFIWTGSIDTIWPLFGVANQLLAAVALAVGTTILINIGRAKVAWVTFVPLSLPVGHDADRRLHEHPRQLLAAGRSRRTRCIYTPGLRRLDCMAIMLVCAVIIFAAAVRAGCWCCRARHRSSSSSPKRKRASVLSAAAVHRRSALRR